MRETPPQCVSVRGQAHSWGSFWGQELREEFSLGSLHSHLSPCLPFQLLSLKLVAT